MIPYLTNYSCTPSVRRICEMLLAAEHSEDFGDQVLTRFKPGGWMVGSTKVNAAAANKLLWISMVEPMDEHWEDEEVAYFTVRNYAEMREYISNPDFVPPVVAAIRERYAKP